MKSLQTIATFLRSMSSEITRNRETRIFGKAIDKKEFYFWGSPEEGLDENDF